MTRDRAAIACWGLACVGVPLAAHTLLLRPALHERARLSALAAARTADPDADLARAVDPARAAALSRRAEAIQAELRRRALLAHDEAVLLRAVTEAASRHGVVLDSLARTEHARPGGPAPAHDAAPAPPAYHRAAYALRVLGPYAGVAALLDELQRVGGYVSFRSVRLAPDPQPSSPWLEGAVLAEFVAPTRPPEPSVIPKEIGDATAR